VRVGDKLLGKSFEKIIIIGDSGISGPITTGLKREQRKL
jgi:hypothetical protein